MPATSSLIRKLANRFADFRFIAADEAHWSPQTHAVYYNPHEAHAEWVLLHETAHAILEHRQYARDIELLAMERAAWDYAIDSLGPDFSIQIDREFAEQQIDSYRDWLHAKSTCPSCQSNGLEVDKHQYTCLQCHATWRTNTGIDVGIRRRITA